MDKSLKGYTILIVKTFQGSRILFKNRNTITRISKDYAVLCYTDASS